MNTQGELSLSENIKTLKTWEECVSLYLQLNESANNVSWLKADLLAHVTNLYGAKSMSAIANDIGEPPSTVASYARVSKAFLPEQRNPLVSFSHHHQASFSDSLNERTGTFDTNNRHKWIERAVEDNLSTRRLRAQIKEKREIAFAGTTGKKDSLTGEITPGVVKWVFFPVGTQGNAHNFWLCPESVSKILKFIEEYK